MRTRELTVADIGLIASTRAILGVGIGLLLSDKLAPEQRRAAGLALFLVGAVTTFRWLRMYLEARKAKTIAG
jgi:hypothetical protein